MWNKYPILRHVIALLAGMTTAFLILEQTTLNLKIELIAVAITVSTTILCNSNKKFTHKPFTIAALAAFFSIGFFLAHWKYQSVEQGAGYSRNFIKGCVISNVKEKEKWWSFNLSHDNSVDALVYLAKIDSTDKPHFNVGDSIWVISYFNMPTPAKARKAKQEMMDEYNRKKAKRLAEKAKKRILKGKGKAMGRLEDLVEKIDKSNNYLEKLKAYCEEDRMIEKHLDQLRKEDIGEFHRLKNKHIAEVDREIVIIDSLNHLKDSLIIIANTSTEQADSIAMAVKDSVDNENFSLTEEERKQIDKFYDYVFFQGISDMFYASDGAWGFLNEMKERKHDIPIAERMKYLYANAQFSDNAEAVMAAVTTGDKTLISQQIREAFSKAGVSHVLALSGFHLTVIVTILNLLLARVWMGRRWKCITGIVVIIAIWAFAALAGFTPSLVRATVMCTIMQLAFFTDRVGQNMKNATAIALFVMILPNPMIIRDIGFQLSFASIIGIAFLGLPLCEWIGKKTGKWAVILDVVAISATCSLFTFPLTAYHFGMIPLYSILTNLAISILAIVLIWAAVAWWALFWWNNFQRIITNVVNLNVEAMTWIATKVAQLPGATIHFKPDIFLVVALYAIMFMAFSSLAKRLSH